MRRIFHGGVLQLALLMAIGLVLASCVRIPDADYLANGPKIDEIVQRVKCDLYQSVAARLDAPFGYEWLHFWTAQASLNLIVNDQSQIAPGAVFTQPLTTESIPGRVTNMARSWNLGLGAQATDTATRNETITFTVSLDELNTDFKNHPNNCLFPDFIDLQSELGLQEWIDASFSPVEHGYLTSGYHKAPKTGAGTASAKAAIHAVLGAAPSNNGSAQPPDCKPRLPITVGREQLHFDLVFCDLSVVNSIPDLTQLDGPQVQFVAKTVTDIQALIRDLIGKKGTEKTIKALENTAIALAVFLDPPLDTISHQVQFIVLWNASANRSWTLLHFKGPSPSSGSMFSATKTSTHTLNIVLGPPSSPDLLNALSALQIGTAVSNAVNTAPTSPH